MNYALFDIKSHFERDVELNVFKGSMIRGSLGHALKSTVCAVRVKVCETCLLRSTCLYPRIFELKHDRGQLSGQAHRPHPYVIDSQSMSSTHYAQGQPFTFSLLLFGNTIQFFPYFLYSFELMGRSGLGRRTEQGRATFVLDEVSSRGELLYTPIKTNLPTPLPHQTLNLESANENGERSATNLSIHFLSPLRVKKQGKFVHDLDFVDLMQMTFRRLRALYTEFSDKNWQVDENNLLKQAAAVQVKHKQLKWEEYTRYSNRQKSTQKMGGVTGTMQVEGDLSQFLPFLQAAEVVHLGKETSFGLGKVQISILKN